MQAIIFFTLAISAMVFVIYLGARSTMRGMKAKSERLTEEEELKNLPENNTGMISCLLYTSPSPRDGLLSRMPSSA